MEIFRIARIRIRWMNKNEPIPESAPSLTDQGVSRGSVRASRAFHPLDLKVRLRWVGWGPVDVPAIAAAPAPMTARDAIPSSARVLTTLDLPNVRLRVRWLGLGVLKRPLAVALVLFLGMILYSAWTGSNNPGKTEDPIFDPQQGLLSDLMSDDIQVGNETIRMIHSPLDIGSAKDVFDGNLETLMRGRDANPFVFDIEFPQPEVIKGFAMDMGRMDFIVRVQVYGTDSKEPMIYQGEYRQQPAIPHVDMDFVSGPGLVKRIYIEIEQIDPPEEVHVHVREVVFKK